MIYKSFNEKFFLGAKRHYAIADGLTVAQFAFFGETKGFRIHAKTSDPLPMSPVIISDNGWL